MYLKLIKDIIVGWINLFNNHSIIHIEKIYHTSYNLISPSIMIFFKDISNSTKWLLIILDIPTQHKKCPMVLYIFIKQTIKVYIST